MEDNGLADSFLMNFYVSIDVLDLWCWAVVLSYASFYIIPVHWMNCCFFWCIIIGKGGKYGAIFKKIGQKSLNEQNSEFCLCFLLVAVYKSRATSIMSLSNILYSKYRNYLPSTRLFLTFKLLECWLHHLSTTCVSFWCCFTWYVESSGKMKVYHGYLASSYHTAIISGFSLISSYLESVASSGNRVTLILFSLWNIW